MAKNHDSHQSTTQSQPNSSPAGRRQPRLRSRPPRDGMRLVTNTRADSPTATTGSSVSFRIGLGQTIAGTVTTSAAPRNVDARHARLAAVGRAKRPQASDASRATPSCLPYRAQRDQSESEAVCSMRDRRAHAHESGRNGVHLSSRPRGRDGWPASASVAQRSRADGAARPCGHSARDDPSDSAGGSDRASTAVAAGIFGWEPDR